MPGVGRDGWWVAEWSVCRADDAGCPGPTYGVLDRPGLPGDAADEYRGGCGDVEPGHVLAGVGAGAVAGGVRGAVGAPGRCPVRGEPEPDPVPHPVPGDPQAGAR